MRDEANLIHELAIGTLKNWFFTDGIKPNFVHRLKWLHIMMNKSQTW